MFFERWIGVFGAPAQILSDNGLEFQNEEMRRVADRFQIKMLFTAAESPWSNGVCDKAVGLMKEVLRKLKVEEKVSRQMAMMWTAAARNRLMMKDGFSPSQWCLGETQICQTLLETIIQVVWKGERKKSI